MQGDKHRPYFAVKSDQNQLYIYMTILIFKCVQHRQILLQLVLVIKVYKHWTILKYFILVVWWFFFPPIQISRLLNLEMALPVLSLATFCFSVCLLKKGFCSEGEDLHKVYCMKTTEKNLHCSSVRSGKICQTIA